MTTNTTPGVPDTSSSTDEKRTFDNGLSEKQVGHTATPDGDAQMLEGPQFSIEATKALLRKCDWHLLPFLAVLYLLSFLDRTNVGNAKLANLEVDLGMTGKWDYNTAVAVFFPFYVGAEIPSNLAMKRFRPSIWIPSIMVAWAICTTLMGVVHNFAGLLVVRCALGLAEGGLFPGITYYCTHTRLSITMWYRRHECGFRMAIFFSAATAAGAFGGLLARGIMEMEGIGGKGGWAWIFIIEGLLTFVVAIAAFKAMHDYPDTARFLNDEEKKEIVLRLEADRSALSNVFDLKYMKHAFKDWKIWVHMFITIGIYTPLYSISIFLPSIVKGMGYTNETAQLMTVPPYVAGCICCITCGILADKYQRRGYFMIGNCLCAMIGFAILTGAKAHGPKYFACFLIVMGVYANVPQGVAWNGNNIGGSVKRGVGIAMHVGFGNLGGAIAGFIYRADDAPDYQTGHATLLGTETMSCILCILMHLYLVRENKRRDREYKDPKTYTKEEMLTEQDSGDNATFFRYTV